MREWFIAGLFCTALAGSAISISAYHAKAERASIPSPTCTVERVTFPASAEECARIHKAIERRIANETT